MVPEHFAHKTITYNQNVKKSVLKQDDYNGDFNFYGFLL